MRTAESGGCESMRSVYWNPFTREGHLAEWRDHTPAAPGPQSGRVRLDNIRILESQSAVVVMIAAEELAALAMQIESAVRKVGEAGTATYLMLLEAALGPSAQVAIRIATKGSAPASELQ